MIGCYNELFGRYTLSIPEQGYPGLRPVTNVCRAGTPRIPAPEGYPKNATQRIPHGIRWIPFGANAWLRLGQRLLQYLFCCTLIAPWAGPDHSLVTLLPAPPVLPGAPYTAGTAMHIQ